MFMDKVTMNGNKPFTLIYDDGEKRVSVKCVGCDLFEATEHLQEAIERAEQKKNQRVRSKK